MALADGVRIHFMGIGGIGMSGLATLCMGQRCRVSGCDTSMNVQARELQSRGATISVGHDPDHLHEDVDLLVYSSAVSPTDPELLEAKVRGIPTMSRGELLAALARTKRLIGVAGAHGKTTTSGMTAQLLVQAGWDPSIVVGGVMKTLGTNARLGTGNYIVAETDESDGSFLHLSPTVAVVTNIDREHLNYYQSFERLVCAFQTFVTRLPHDGTLICCDDDPIIRGVLYHPRTITYGFNPNADITVEDVAPEGFGSRFKVRYKGRNLGTFKLSVPGRHNVLNALAVISVGLSLGIPIITMRDSLLAFQGTKRRYQVQRLPGDICIIEDYAHHPSEIQATLSADPLLERHRLVVFQPHRFSRTQSLEREFAKCFDRADGVIVTDIYSAFEAPIPGVSGERLAEMIKASGHPCVSYVPKQELTSFVSRMVRSGDTIFFLGAGDIGEMCHVVANQLHSAV